MKLRELGSSQVQVSPIVMGTCAIGGWKGRQTDEHDAITTILKSYEVGITTIDTAPIYGYGKCESLIAKALAGIPRQNYQILSKFGLHWYSKHGHFKYMLEDDNGNPIPIYAWASKERVIKECENSLRRLNTDYIDLYQIHWPDPTTPISETMEALAQLIQAGKIRAAGVCNYSFEQVEEALKIIPLASHQIPYSLINRTHEKDLIPQAIKNGMDILAYSTLQRGLLTGKILPNYTFSGYDSRRNSPFFSTVNIQQTHVLLDKLRPIAEAHQATLAQLVLNWTLHQPGFGAVVVGARTPNQVVDNARALALELSPSELATITSAAKDFTLIH